MGFQHFQGTNTQTKLLYLQLTIMQWLKNAQELMSGTASNYDVSKLVTGQVIAGIGLLLAAISAGPTIAESLRTSLPFIAMTLVYGATMTASSFVEEEHHFWYWATSFWLSLLWIKRYATSQFRRVELTII
jgi:ethanolaminephosphotransferase